MRSGSSGRNLFDVFEQFFGGGGFGAFWCRETRQKIATAVQQTWDRRHLTCRMIAHCHREWLDLIAEASRNGLYGKEELQWNSYGIMSKQLDKGFRERIESRKKKC
ncbi:hypothetical protein CTI12_AA330880 [Artemisia annua]|uniref:Uncharacterized protein n=1 Tax=Artemisia annua TaxID=35608 RepID=A0A2U1MXB9_ARTAN|nr:hypothetical protein CTI12_AA330880 [Artemisia annua]